MESKEKRPRRTRKKKIPPQSQHVDDELDPVFEEALTSFLKTHAKRKGKSIKNIKALEGLLSQYLNSFILIGYSQDTKEFVSLINAHDEQSADSLSTALNKFIMNNIKKNPGSYPPVF